MEKPTGHIKQGVIKRAKNKNAKFVIKFKRTQHQVMKNKKKTMHETYSRTIRSKKK